MDTLGETIYDEETKLWCGKKSNIVFDTKINLASAILWTLSNNPDKIVQISHESNIQFTAGFMKQQTIRAAANLRKLGYEQGDIFCFVARNSPNLAPIFYASLSLACPINPLAATSTKADIVHMISITKPKLMFCDVDLYELVQDCLNELGNGAPIYTFEGSAGDSIPVENLFEEIPEVNEFSVAEIDGENTTALILCTSGSTGLPKGVSLSHAILLLQSLEGFPFNGNDVALSFSSIYWISGILIYIGGGLKGSCRVITTQGFNPELLLEMVEQHRITFFMSASYYLVVTLRSEKIHESDLSSIKSILCGGSKLLISTALEMIKYLPNGKMAEAYGMSEVGGVTSIGYVETEEDTSVGQLALGIKVKIVDDDGNRLGVNETGEICTETVFKFLGYFDNEEATMNSIDDEGFLKTGDIGYFDSDGNLHMVDRKKDMIKYCNSQVAPSEIEQFLIQIPCIKVISVVGIPDPVVGDLPAAVIIPNADEELLSKEEIQQMVADAFADYKQLRGGVYFVESMPLTASGKIMRRKVKEQAIELYEAENATAES